MKTKLSRSDRKQFTNRKLWNRFLEIHPDDLEAQVALACQRFEQREDRHERWLQEDDARTVVETVDEAVDAFLDLPSPQYTLEYGKPELKNHRRKLFQSSVLPSALVTAIMPFADSQTVEQMATFAMLTAYGLTIATSDLRTDFNMNLAAYHPLDRAISHQQTDFKNLVHQHAHEYAHAHLSRRGFSDSRHSLLHEGCATGVARNVERRLADGAPSAGGLYNDAALKTQAYLLFTEHNDLPQDPQHTAAFHRLWNGQKIATRKSLAWKPIAHAVGDMLFTLEEQKQGPHIYRAVLHGEFEFS